MVLREKSNEWAEFIASFPDIQSAITFHGSGGMRIQLDIPENQVGEAAKLLMWREKALRIVVAPELGYEWQQDVRTISRTTAKKRNS